MKTVTPPLSVTPPLLEAQMMPIEVMHESQVIEHHYDQCSAPEPKQMMEFEAKPMVLLAKCSAPEPEVMEAELCSSPEPELLEHTPMMFRRRANRVDEPEYNECMEAEAEEIDIDLDDPQVEQAAVKIQAGFKGMQARKEVKQKREVSLVGFEYNSCNMRRRETWSSQVFLRLIERK